MLSRARDINRNIPRQSHHARHWYSRLTARRARFVMLMIMRTKGGQSRLEFLEVDRNEMKQLHINSSENRVRAERGEMCFNVRERERERERDRE